MTTIRRLFPLPGTAGLFLGTMIFLSSLPCSAVARTDAADDRTATGDFYCGPRCVQRILRYYGVYRDIYDLASQGPSGLMPSGASMSDLSRWLTGAGVHCVPVRLAGAGTRPWPCPVIIHTGPVAEGDAAFVGHWVAAIPLGSSGNYAVHYAVGDVRNENWSELIGHTSGNVLLTSSTAIDPTLTRDFLLPRPFRSSIIAAYVFVLSGVVVLATSAFNRANHCVHNHLMAGFFARNGCGYMWQRPFIRGWLLAAVVICGVIAIIPSNKPRILSTSESAMLRGGAPAGCTDCYIPGAPTQCGVGYQTFMCGEEPCPEDGDCSSEIAILQKNATKHTVACQFGNTPIGNGGYTSTKITCSWGLACAAACIPDTGGAMRCQNGPGPAGVIDFDQSEDPNPAAPQCKVTEWKRPGKLRYPDRFTLIARMNGVSL